MADALLSPAVAGTMWGISGAGIAYCSAKVKKDMDDRMIPLMGVMGAFIFAAQMINFTIPGTGSSGHIVGGLLLAILLGPYAAFLVIASVLVVQALFFADGGLLALGCNIFNMGFLPTFIAYPFIYKKIVGNSSNKKRITIGAVTASVVGLQLGALSVVIQTVLSGISALPFGTFLLLMLPIHFAIGIIEGIVTAGVVAFVCRVKPEIFQQNREISPFNKVVALFIFMAFITGSFVSLFASENPDGLEWAVSKVTDNKGISEGNTQVHTFFSYLQSKISLLPDYSFKHNEPSLDTDVAENGNQKSRANLATTISGVVGGIISMVFVFLIGMFLKKSKKEIKNEQNSD